MLTFDQNNPTTLKLKTEDGKPCSVKVSLKYIPIKMQLDPSESINNMGKLRVDILDAADLPSADRNGKSDPYCKFELNGQEIYKTKVQKKTLNPSWNEFFEVNVPSRTGAKFSVTVWDYDFADKPDFLGGADINLEPLDPFKPSESKYILDGKSGSVRIRLLFRPDYVTRTRQGTSTFGTFGPGRIVTGVAGAPIKGGAAVAGVVGHGVGRGASFLKRGLRGKKDRSDFEEDSLPEVAEMPSVAVNGQDIASSNNFSRPTGSSEGTDSLRERPTTSNGTAHSRNKSLGQSSTYSNMPGGAPAGTASFTVLNASGFPPSSDLYVIITQISPKEKTVGKTKHYKSGTGEWNFGETFNFKCTPDSQFKIEAKGEHFIGKHDELGEHIYFVDESGSGVPKELSIGSGIVLVKSSFQPTESPQPESPKQNMRRSFMSKRDGRISREGTPNP